MKSLLLCVGILVLAIGGAAAEPGASAEVEGQEEEIEILARNIRLDFKMVPLEADDKGVFLVTASSWYQTSVRFEREGTEIEFGVSGHVRIVEDDRLFITYEGHVEFSGQEEKAEFHVDSSALLQPGEECQVASMGDKTLVIRASYVDVKQTEE